MIKLKQILNEINTKDIIKRLLVKIQHQQYQRIGAGDNGIVNKINGEDYVFKVTQEPAEFEVAEVIVGRETEFNTFIPVLYVHQPKMMYISGAASKLPTIYREWISGFEQKFNEYSASLRGEVTIFEYLDAEGGRDTHPTLVSFLRALQEDIRKTGIEDLDLDIDFNEDNVMLYNGQMVMIDW